MYVIEFLFFQRQRPRMFDFLTGGGDRGGSTNIKPPLSPIASSPEEGGSTPTDSPGTNRPKHLQLPPLGLGLFSKQVSSSTSLHKHNSSTGMHNAFQNFFTNPKTFQTFFQEFLLKSFKMSARTINFLCNHFTDYTFGIKHYQD